jgi:DNA polymerase-3 subunit delta'
MKLQLPISPSLIRAHESKLAPLFERFQREKALHPTLLITGLDGVGKKEMALHLVQYLFCDRSIFAGQGNQEPETDSLFGETVDSTPQIQPILTKEFVACQDCKSCKRALQNQWLDLHWLEPETNDDETRLGTHKIDAFRELKSKLGMGPMEEPYKVVVIADADRMTIQAANSILKTLEEPPKNWIFILTAADSSRLLPTILSRCIELKFSPLSAQQVYEVIKEMKNADFHSGRAQMASRAAMGSVTRAQLFLEEEALKIREALLGFLSNPAQEWMKLIELFAQSQREMILGLDMIESIYTDLLKARVEGQGYAWIHDDQKEFLTQWMASKKINEHKLIHVLSSVAEKRRLATLTLNSKLLAQEVLIPLLEIMI